MTALGYELKKIDAAEHDSFMQSSPKEHFMQHSLWGKIKALGEWDDELLGLYDEGRLVASVMLLHRPIPVLGGTVYYAPRGFVADFSDFGIITAFTAKIKEYLKGKKAVYFIFDPDY